MKKYKLIKEYPNSPPLDDEKSNLITLYHDGYYHNNNTLYPVIIHSSCIDKYSDYWEEVIEKDYEIVTLKHKQNKHFYTEVINLRNLDKYDIWSVKRLSDGEIFTIGDNTKSIGVIESFEMTVCGDLRVNGKKVYDDIKFIKHSKKPLFTTEDGVDIFEDENGEIKYWGLQLPNDAFLAKNQWKISNGPIIVKDIIPHSTKALKKVGYLRFSTKEAAEEYIEMNKPHYSLNDIIKVFNVKRSRYLDTLLNELKSLKND